MSGQRAIPITAYARRRLSPGEREGDTITRYGVIMLHAM